MWSVIISSILLSILTIVLYTLGFIYPILFIYFMLLIFAFRSPWEDVHIFFRDCSLNFSWFCFLTLILTGILLFIYYKLFLV